MRALEQRFLFDGAAIIDPVWLVEASPHAITPLVLVQENKITAETHLRTDSTLVAQINADGINTKGSDNVTDIAPADGSMLDVARTEENLTPPKQLVFGVLPNEIKLVEATALATQKLITFANSEEFFSVITQRFGPVKTDANLWEQAVFKLKETMTQSGLGIRLEVLPDLVMNGALGAYTMGAGDGLETIYLNAEWLDHVVSIDDLVAVQIEEIGHAIDHRLNGLIDSPGDEGQAFSNDLLPQSHPVLLDGAEDDHAILIMNGISIDVECAAPTLSASANLTYVENSASIAANPSITVTDADGLLKTATITVSSFQVGDNLSFTPVTSGNPVNRTGPITIKENVHGVLTLWAGSADSTATVQQWKNALRAVRYSSLSDDPTVNDTAVSRSIGFVVSDGTSTSNVISSTVNITAINDAPIATVIPSNPTFSEGSGSTQGAAVYLFSAASISTVESGQSIVGLTFTAKQMLDGADEKIVVDGTSISLHVANTYATGSGYAATVTLGSGGNTGTTTVSLSMESGVVTSTGETLIKGIAFQNTKVDNPTEGNRVFTLTQLKDGGGTASNGLDTTTFNVVSTVSVAAVNDAPLAFADVATAAEAGGSDNAIVGIDPSGNVLTNDTDVDHGDTKFVSALVGGTLGSATAGSFGWLTLTGDGNYTYTVDNNNSDVQSLQTPTDTLTDTFIYTLRDSAGLTSSNTLTVTIQGMNDAPEITSVTAPSLIVDGSNNETSFVAVVGTVTASDVDGTISYAVETGTDATGSSKSGSYGTLTISGNAYSYAPDVTKVNALAEGSNQTDSFTVVVTDDSGVAVRQTLTFTIAGVNDAPLITSMTAPSLVVDGSNNETSFAAVVGTVTASDIDGTISYAVETGPDMFGSSKAGAYGTLTISGNAYSYAPDVAKVNALAAGSNPTDSFTVVVTDDSGVAVRQTLTFTIEGANDAPQVISTQSFFLDENDPLLTINLLDKSTDADGDSLYVTDIVVSANGIVVSAASVGLSVNDSSLTLSPSAPIFEQLPANETIEITINYKVSDGGIPVSATRVINITGVNDVAIVTPATPSVASVQEDATLTASGVLTVIDADASQQAFRGVAPDKPLQGKYGTLSITSAGLWIYTLNNNLAIVQNLNDGESLNDEQFTLTTIDGTGVVTLKLSVQGQDEFILPLLAPSALRFSGAAGPDMTPMMVLAPAPPEARAASASSPIRSTVSAVSGRLSGGPLMGALGLGFLGGANGGAVAGPGVVTPGNGQDAAVVNDAGAASNNGPAPVGATQGRDQGRDQGANKDVNQDANQGGNTIPEVVVIPGDGDGAQTLNTALPLKDQRAALSDQKSAAVRQAAPETAHHFRKSFSNQIRIALLGRSPIR